MNLKDIQAIVLDVDGVLTDGRLTPAPQGDIGKRFNARDGFALKIWRDAGGRAAILSGRFSEEVERRAAELGISHVRQKVENKIEGLQALLLALDVAASKTAYVGDDIPDLPAMTRCGFRVTVADGAQAVKRVANLVTRRGGGEGAVAEFVEWLLRKQGRWPSRAPSL